MPTTAPTSTMTAKERFYATLEGQPRDRAPVTPIVMQWAADFIGRTYREYYLDGGVLAEAQVAVAREFHTDWVSVMSDPWCESSAYGMTFDYPEDATGVPRDHLVHSLDEAKQLPPLDLDDERVQCRLRCIRDEVAAVGHTHPVVGWVEGPIAQYADLRGIQSAMMDLLDDVSGFHAVAEHLVSEAIRFSAVQVEAGADVIGVGDAAASIVGPQLYRDAVLPWEQKLIAGLHGLGAKVKLHICGDLKPILADVVTTGADIIDLDSMVPIADARAASSDQVFAGNFDPAAVLLNGSPRDVRAAAERCLAEGGERFMLQPGCEVPHGTPMDNMRAFCPGA